MAAKQGYSDEQRLEVKRASGRSYAARERREHPDRVKERNARARARTLADMQADPADSRHGTNSGYVCGCRCASCREAARAQSADYHARKRAEAGRERYERTPDPRYAEIMRLRAENVTNAEIAKRLGYADRKVVSNIATRLGMPKRKPGRRKNQ